MGDGTGQEAATAVKAKPVDDEDEATLEYEEIRVGEIITYYTRLFVAGDPRGKRVSKIVRIRSDIKNEYPIHVESQDAISKHDMVKRVKDAQGNAVECGLYRKVYTYELIPGKIRGEMASAVLKAAMKNVVRDSFAKVYGSEPPASKKRRRDAAVDEGKQQHASYKPKRKAASTTKPTTTSSKPISISKFFLPKSTATTSDIPLQQSKGPEPAASRNVDKAANTRNDDPLCFMSPTTEKPTSPLQVKSTSSNKVAAMVVCTGTSRESISTTAKERWPPKSSTKIERPPIKSSAAWCESTQPLFKLPQAASNPAKRSSSSSKQAMTSSSESIAPSHPFIKPTGATPSSVRPVKTASSTYFNKVERVPRSNNHIAATSTTRTLDPTAPVSPAGPPTRSLTNDKVDEDSFMSPVSSALSSSQVSSRAFVPPSISSKASQPFSNSSRSSSGSLGTASFRHRDRLPPPEKRSMSSPTPLTTTDIALRALALSAAATVKRKPVDDYDTYKARQDKKTSREEWKTRKSSLASLENPPPRRSSSSDKALQSQRLAAFVLKRQDEEDVAERGHVTPRKKQWRQQRAAFQGSQSMFHAINPPQLQEMSSDGWSIPKKLAK